MIFKAVCSIPQRERWDHTLKFMVCIFTDWYVTGALVRKPQLYDALGQMLFWHYAYFTVISILNQGGGFAHICKMQSMKSSGVVASIRPNKVKVCLPCGAADKTIGLFPRFLDSSFVIYFSLSLIFKEKKRLISMKLLSGKPVLYMKEKHFFGKWNAYGNTPASSVRVIC